MLDLKAIKDRLAAATPGPWWVALNGYDDLTIHYGNPDRDDETYDLLEHYERSDYALMASAPTDIAALVAEVERLQAIEAAAWRFSVLQAEYDKAIHAEHDISEETLLAIGLDHAQAVAELIALLTP